MADSDGLAAIETPQLMAAMKDKPATVDAHNHYSVGWARPYDGVSEWSQVNDPAAQMPPPIDDRRFDRLNPTLARRPQLIMGTPSVLFPGMRRVTAASTTLPAGAAV